MAAAPPRAWQRMLSGRRLDLLDPSPLDVEIEDVALGLARVARWNGQTQGLHAFSVAQHSLVVVDLVDKPGTPRGLALAALLHDAAEYVTSDLITPFKAAIGGDYKAVEQRLEHAIRIRFGLPAQLPEDWRRPIKRADKIAAFREAICLAGFSEPDARRVLHFKGTAPPLMLEPWDPETARTRFLERFAALAG